MAIANTLKDHLDNEGIQYDLVGHPFSVTSMKTAFEAHVSGENIAKAVVLHDGHGYILVVVTATQQVQLGKLRKKFNRYLSLAEEKDLHEIFSDCSLGAIPPVGRAYGVNVLFDDHLTECEDIYFEAGDHTDLIHVSGKDFLALMGNVSHGEFSRHI